MATEKSDILLAEANKLYKKYLEHDSNRGKKIADKLTPISTVYDIDAEDMLLKCIMKYKEYIKEISK